MRGNVVTYAHPLDLALGEGAAEDDIAEFCREVVAEATREEFDAHVKAAEEDRKKPATGTVPIPSTTEKKPSEADEATTTTTGKLPVHTSDGGTSEAVLDDQEEPAAEAANEAQPEQVVSGDFLVRGDFRWSIPRDDSQVYDCWDREGNVLGSVKGVHHIWEPVLELPKCHSRDESMAAVEAAWTKLHS